MYIQQNIETELEYILNPNAEYEVFNFTALKAATDNFSDVNKLGKGGFGPVYKVQSLLPSNFPCLNLQQKIFLSNFLSDQIQNNIYKGNIFYKGHSS